MQEDKEYSLGYVHGVIQARPLVDLEHKVKSTETRVTILTWGGAILGTITLLNTIIPLVRKLLRGSKGGDKNHYGKQGKNEHDMTQEEKGNGTKTNDHKFRRHVRDFNICN
jgi:hypothetical protein